MAFRHLDRVAVIGTTGTGKTIFARRLAAALDAPHVELDALYWGPGWTRRGSFRQDVLDAIRQPRWVVEGTVSHRAEPRRAADGLWPRLTPSVRRIARRGDVTMDRRRFVVALSAGLVAAPGSARAQARKSARIGWVGAWYSPSAAASLFDAFRQGMRELGYVEGQNLTIDARWMEGNTPDEAARLTAELVRSKVDVLVAQGTAVPGVKAEAGSTPVVFGFSGDPVAAKLVTSLARPGGNLTGMTLLAVELAGKRVELLKEAAPRVSRVAVLTNPLHVGEDQELRESELAAQRLKLTVRQFPVRTVTEVNAALEAMARDHVDAVVALSNLLIMRQRNAIAEFAVKQRIPTISGWQDFAVDGNLMSYGPDLQHAWRRAAIYVDKVLKGTKPADLPVEQPTTFQLVINLKTAKAIGLTIPPSVLIRADRIVE